MVSVITPTFQTVSQNGMMDEVQIWHVDVTGTQSVPCFKVTLNSHK